MAVFDGMVRALLKSVIDHIYFINVYREIPGRFASDLVPFSDAFPGIFWSALLETNVEPSFLF